MDLPLDIKYKIASFDVDAWIKLSYIDDEFKKFSFKEGRKLFIDLFTIIKINKHWVEWRIFDKLHGFNDQPAIIWQDGRQEWYQNGNRHRNNDQPAIICTDGQQEWYQNGNRHRDNDRPAVVCANGDKYWLQNDQSHRDGPDGQQPAIICANGTKEWYQNGRYIKIKSNNQF